MPMKNISSRFFVVVCTLIVICTTLLMFSCGSEINTVQDPHFNSDGTLIDAKEKKFSMKTPTAIRWFVEVSGSMNGFFRANMPTHFKHDVWQMLSYYSALSPRVTVLTNDGNIGADIPTKQFQTMMNTGAFVSSASTRVPLMLQSIIDTLNVDCGEVAVLVSDMKYSPVGQAAPQVLLEQYSTDISKILGTYGKAISLIGATSNYLDKQGNSVTNKSPYYYVIIGNAEQVAEVRNVISTMLEQNGHFIDNIETGFDYGKIYYSFGITDNCWQMDDENPTFVGCDPSAPASIKIKLHLENYRWRLANEQILREALKVKALYGSIVKVGKIEIKEENITKKELKRKATATIELQLSNMAQDSEVIEWTLELPDTEYTLFNPFFGAQSEDDVTKSYSVDNFIKGMFQGGVVNQPLKPQYILVSTEE